MSSPKELGQIVTRIRKKCKENSNFRHTFVYMPKTRGYFSVFLVNFLNKFQKISLLCRNSVFHRQSLSFCGAPAPLECNAFSDPAMIVFVRSCREMCKKQHPIPTSDAFARKRYGAHKILLIPHRSQHHPANRGYRQTPQHWCNPVLPAFGKPACCGFRCDSIPESADPYPAIPGSPRYR